METKKGFTIIELVLSMAFVGTLLITIASITINIISIYQKGLAIRSVNSVGSELIDEFTRVIEESPTKAAVNLCGQYYYNNAASRSKCEKDNGQLFIFQQNRSTKTVNLTDATNLTGDTKVTTPPTHGVFCTGKYSYIWNTGYVLNGEYGLTNQAALLHFKTLDDGKEHDIEGFRLVRVTDQNREVCSNNVTSNYTLKSERRKNQDMYDLGEQVTYTNPPDLLDDMEDNLALYDMQIFPPTQHSLTAHTYYSGTFILATLRGAVNIKTNGDYCNTIPDNLNTDFAYCALNKFNFATRATGELNASEQHELRKTTN